MLRNNTGAYAVVRLGSALDYSVALAGLKSSRPLYLLVVEYDVKAR